MWWGNVSGGLPLSQNLTWNGLRTSVVPVNKDAWALVKAQNENNAPPFEGKCMLMITVQVANVEGQSDELAEVIPRCILNYPTEFGRRAFLAPAALAGRF